MVINIEVLNAKRLQILKSQIFVGLTKVVRCHLGFDLLLIKRYVYEYI